MLETDFLTQNAITKESMFTALMRLMQEKSFSQISITEISQKAGVSRMSYYRNYQSKEDIITTYLDELFDQFISEVERNPHFNQHFGLTLFFLSCKQNELLIKNIIAHDLTALISERLNLYLTFLLKHLYENDGDHAIINPYLTEYLCGGLCKVAMVWVKNGMQESADEMVAIIEKLSHPLDKLVLDK
ncbi:MAG TPA: TetR/AcrR family transcriptional regulator [Firmicutes bacterium]|nr:TetR/AcrR family transcriptional regulator [Bacillota bacterium]